MLARIYYRLRDGITLPRKGLRRQLTTDICRHVVLCCVDTAHCSYHNSY